ncbi:sigma-70 family RNA polymerase sigma factor [Leptothoe spongobia]|uniref:Sigma-70 family RNA polymerase sigma factor n=1 Tax=Leptothoe spongobia TAU-MAC 1115 TaxID=1967444 RepID=A0A947GKN6_9CYAN|nr:sigma-70 family RNA polymerase sigma factor [Leptothoe spongobia]MBT9317634.1 sigma-70 family RNA polymerase sigma factor [Leptothoe spongobia TAU-MAC 1115]
MARFSTDTSDIELIHSLRAGHQEALAVLYDRYGGLVYTVALRLLKQPAEAEDLTQDIFFNFWKQNKYDPGRAVLSTYLGLVARSRALDRIAKRSTQQRSLQRLQGSIPERAMTPLENATLSEQQETVQQALSQLKDQQRQVLEMNFYQGISHADIARQLDMPLGTVKTRARQGLIELRRRLGGAVG